VDPYQVAHDVTGAIRIFHGCYWYETTVWIPYCARETMRLCRYTPESTYCTVMVAFMYGWMPQFTLYTPGLSNLN
jgi:hypothetical protein